MATPTLVTPPVRGVPPTDTDAPAFDMLETDGFLGVEANDVDPPLIWDTEAPGAALLVPMLVSPTGVDNPKPMGAPPC